MNETVHISPPRIPDLEIGVSGASYVPLAGVFTATAARLPDKTALRFRDTHITYGALDRRTDAWAARLQARGIGPGQFVGVWVDRSVELHAAVLAVLKTGAAYIPFDPDAPRDRVETSLDDCGATAILVDARHQEWAETLAAPAIAVADLDGTLPQTGFVPVTPAGEDPAYVIYTSGSTGRPKGIAVSQSNISHLLQSENAVLQVRETDIVYQGFSPAFDMSLEEVFISYLAGATLVVAPPELVRAADALPAVLQAHGVTVLHCVPTLLAMLTEDVPSLRLINMGGEACPAALVDRWWREGRRLLNTYGPTETTVTATAAEMHPGDPITIGHPLPGYTAYILDETTLAPVAAGEAGELFIGGPGVSLGYIGRPELTAEKFIANPVAKAAVADPRIYRTGDKASYDAAGRIVFHGRLDDQVKFRGYRIETGEIEAELGKLDMVRAAAVVLREDQAGTQHLVAFIASAASSPADPKQLRQALAARLPAYMLPTLFQAIEVVPRLPSGKINRKALPELTETVSIDEDRVVVPPDGPAEAELLEAWQALFPQVRVSVTDDFFLDLGGHSLLAARLASQLRQQPRYRLISIQDLYDHRTIRALAAAHVDTSPAVAKPAFAPVDRWRHAACGAAQVVALIPIYGLVALLFIVPYLVFSALMEFDHGLWHSILGTLISFVLTPPLITGIAIAAKWLVIGRFRAGSYPLWGQYYFRWWFVTRMLNVVPASFMADTPAQAFYCRLLGARIGRDAHLGSVTFGAPDLVEIGAGSSVGNEVRFANAAVEGGMLRLGSIRLGADSYVGSRTVIEGNTTIGDHGELDNLSALPEGGAIPAGEVWRGSPAAFHRKAEAAAPETPPSPARRVVFDLSLCLVMLIFPVVAFVPLVPGMVIFDQIYDARWQVEVPLAALLPVLSVLYVGLMLTEIVVLRWLLVGRVREGSHPVRSGFFLRKWFVDHLMELALGAVHAIYASLYVVPWLRLLGMRIGRRAEVSTATSMTHDLVEIGEEAFIADGVMLGDAEIRRGVLTLRKTKVGRRSFIGNSALVPDGSAIPDECLVGCLSIPPDRTDPALMPGQTCLGTPAFILPRRQSFLDHDPQLTFRPGPARVASRLVIELIRILLPPMLFILLLGGAMEAFDQVYDRHGLLVSYASVPFVYVLFVALPSLVIVAALKWLLVGRYRSAEVPMWTPFVWLSEGITAVYEGLTVPMLLEPLRGTPFLPWAWRLFGVKVGRRVFADTTDITEFDMVRIDDDAALNEGCGPQTHLFEDRVMKIGPVHIGARSVLGTNAIALYGSEIGADATVGSLSLVMKGEAIPPGTVWSGSPARAVG